jgi:hypothetical protein
MTKKRKSKVRPRVHRKLRAIDETCPCCGGKMVMKSTKTAHGIEMKARCLDCEWSEGEC